MMNPNEITLSELQTLVDMPFTVVCGDVDLNEAMLEMNATIALRMATDLDALPQERVDALAQEFDPTLEGIVSGAWEDQPLAQQVRNARNVCFNYAYKAYGKTRGNRRIAPFNKKFETAFPYAALQQASIG